MLTRTLSTTAALLRDHLAPAGTALAGYVLSNAKQLARQVEDKELDTQLKNQIVVGSSV